MATMPEKDEPVIARAREAVSRNRSVLLLAVAGAAASLAAQPFAAVAVVALIILANDRRR